MMFNEPLDVYTFDIDFAGHVSNIVYIRWLEIGRMMLLESAGWPVTKVMARGVVPILASTEIRYRAPIYLGDVVRMEFGIAELGRASAKIDFEITANTKLAATASQTGLFVDAATGRPHRLTPDERDDFAGFVNTPDRLPPNW
jgi:acyl-CoA thioester hydrolase